MSAYYAEIFQTKNILENSKVEFIVSIIDLFLPDTIEDEIINYLKAKKIPMIVLTSYLNDDIRERILKKDIFDYIIKKVNGAYDHLIKLICYLERNIKTKVLVIDDSLISRKLISRLLKTQCLIVLEAESTVEALDLIKTNPDIKLVITDYNMPEMNGFELVNCLCADHPIDKLAIIGISAYGNSLISTNFLKEGANDFIYKPFSDEEFKWRINQNLEFIDTISKLRNIAIKDSLTGLYNRHAIFDLGVKLFENSKRGNIELTISIIDIDNFKTINDTYGHFTGDIVIKRVAGILNSNSRTSDIMARYGGDEFCVISVNLRKENSFTYFERIRNLIANEKIKIKDKEISVTISIGVANLLMENLESSINKADNLLYKAKNGGRNCIITDR